MIFICSFVQARKSLPTKVRMIPHPDLAHEMSAYYFLPMTQYALLDSPPLVHVRGAPGLPHINTHLVKQEHFKWNRNGWCSHPRPVQTYTAILIILLLCYK